MKVSIKDMTVEMEVKNKGITFDVYDNNDKFLGDLVVAKAKLIWCPGKTQPENGHSISWEDFIAYMLTQPKK